jgi:hypothetical protein
MFSKAGTKKNSVFLLFSCHATPELGQNLAQIFVAKLNFSFLFCARYHDFSITENQCCNAIFRAFFVWKLFRSL